jgi:uncharacterized protein involved in exopolysaccharide biosynthesis
MSEDFLHVEESAMNLRDLFGPLIRHKTALVAIVLLVLSGAALVAWSLPPEYKAEMTLLVRHDRVDPAVSADSTVPNQLSGQDVSEQELLSEVELLQSRDVMEQVILDAGLHNPAQFPNAALEAQARERAIRSLQSHVTVTPVRRTMMIRVTYTAPTAQGANQVLQQLEKRYLEKHLAVHRSSGTHEFFGEQVERAKLEVRDAQSRLSEFSDREHVVAPDQERTAVLQQLAVFESSLEQTRAEAADADMRLAATEQLLAGTPQREVTSVRTGSNGALTGQLKSRILEMQLQRDELLRKFTPAYPLVVQLEGQLKVAQDALASAEKAPIVDETTDQNPTFQWLRSEVARIRPQRDALAARMAAIAVTVAQYRDRARRLDAQSLQQEDLARALKTAQDSYALYLQKEEETRIADALDKTRIANVTVADQPRVPQQPSGSREALILWLGFFGSLLAGVGGAYVLDWLSPRFRSADDVQRSLHIPVLASVD